MEHTKGPWLLNKDNLRVYVPDEDTCVARCCGDTFDADNYDECIANARLIAAAPDLLAALRTLSTIRVDAQDHGILVDPDEWNAAWTAARAALAKVEG